MTKKKIRISKDHCEEVMDVLGNVDNGLEFIDLNKDNLEAKKGFSGLIKRCDEMEKRIKYVIIKYFFSYFHKGFLNLNFYYLYHPSSILFIHNIQIIKKYFY